MASIRFNIEKQRYIFCIYYITPNSRMKVDTSVKIEPHQWDKCSQRCIDHACADTINLLLDKIKTTITKKIYEDKIKGVQTCPVILKETIKDIINPTIKEEKQKKYSRSAYFTRFYDILHLYDNNRSAWMEVENEWNEVGISLFPTYEAFKTGKMRYHKNKKDGFKIRVI